ncbi:helix-turn-helix domain-containing protein [Nocardia sp. NEAU-G5]|uniref:Helix-turn-helix domain-containing protein n=1 Tax=Nocardia albiluteola TaxID=2842303 RepID=A0ABS6B5C9_9NOCA|nr:helix-turn-helix domain-containing protein [Nocardia albiluteola]MBU3064936.1 helix-turn-helix domain-containing protein [Nocardia albiluteola]
MDNSGHDIAAAARTLAGRVDQLAVELARAIGKEVVYYGTSAVVPFDVLVAVVTEHLRVVLDGLITGVDFDIDPAAAVGAERAREDIPLAAVLEAYRIGFYRLWEALLGAATGADGETVRSLTAKVIAAQGLYTDAAASGYRREQTRRIERDTDTHSALMDALLHGRLFERWSVWEAADYLRLPATGPFVVVAARAPAPGAEALPEIEPKLRSLDVFSAWWELPELTIGILSFRTEQQLTNALALLSRTATARIGVSSRYDDLRETPEALRYARIAAGGRAEPDDLVSVFDGSILGAAAVSAPEITTKLVAPLFDSFDELAQEEREVLFETFRVWVATDGSLRATGELLFCHPNTVRYRLHRIEERTGRSLSRPRDLAELCFAFEVYRRLL